MKTAFLISLLAITMLFGCHSSRDNGAVESTSTLEKPVAINTDSVAFINAWIQFCDYLSVCDTTKAKSMIRFPLRTRGMLDSDPYFSYSENNCMGPINLYFKQQLGVVPGEKEFAERLKKFRTLYLYPSYDPMSSRIGETIFEKVDGKWKLTFLYVDSNGAVYYEHK